MKVNNPCGIGKKAYLIDNSYAYNIKTGKNEYLAACEFNRYEAKLLQIISPPFMVKEHEMVRVRYKDQIHIVLNHFQDTPKNRSNSLFRFY